MLKRENRLRAKDDFERVRREGNRWRSDCLTLFVLAQGNGPSRFGFVVSKQVAASAVNRHRLKRQMRAAVRQFLVRVPTGCDMVLVARPAAVGATYRLLAEVIGQLLAQAGLLVVKSTETSS